MVDFTGLFQKKVCCWVGSGDSDGATGPKRLITVSWFVSIVLVLIAFIVACASAAKMKTSGSDRIAAFSAMWTVLLLVVVSIMGSAILRRNPYPLSIGILMGIIFIMCQQMLIIFAIFVERSQLAALSDKPAQEAMAVFSFFIFLVYAFFGSLLAVYRSEIIKTTDSSSAMDEPQSLDAGHTEEVKNYA